MVFTFFKRTMFVLVTTFLFSGFVTPSLTFAGTTTAPNLKSASTFGLLGATTTVTDQTTVNGDLGSGGQTGSATVTGKTYIADSAYNTAYADLGTAIAEADAQSTTSPVGTDIGGLTLTPGVYSSTGAVNIGSDVTLSGNGVYIFRIDGAFTTAAGTHVTLTNGADECSIFWVANVATIGANSTLEGTLMSKSSITLGDTSVTDGRILAQTAVTANAADTVIKVPTCGTSPTGTPPTVTPPTGTPPTVTPPTVTPPTVTSPTVTSPTTVTGGQLPVTATPWYNILIAGGALTLIGAAGVSLGWRRRRHH